MIAQDEIRKCRVEWESTELWWAYANKASSNDLAASLYGLHVTARSLELKGISGGDRLRALFTLGETVYEQRFGEPWFPF